MKKYTSDIFLGAGLFLFSVFYFCMSFTIDVFAGFGATMINAQTIPQIYAVILMLLSIYLLIRTVRRIQADKRSGTFTTDEHRLSIREFWNEYYSVIATFILMFAFALALKPVGFIVSSFVYLVAQILVLTPKGQLTRKVIMLAIIIALVSSVLIDWLFVTQFSVLLPQGILGF